MHRMDCGGGDDSCCVTVFISALYLIGINLRGIPHLAHTLTNSTDLVTVWLVTVRPT